MKHVRLITGFQDTWKYFLEKTLEKNTDFGRWWIDYACEITRLPERVCEKLCFVGACV